MRLALVALIVAAVAGCSNADDAHPQAYVTSAFGTPFVIALKVPACGVTLGLAGPASAALTLATKAPADQTLQARQALEDGIRDNCGPPYAVDPTAFPAGRE